MGADAFADLMQQVDPPLVVVTTAAEGVRAGCVVGFHGQSSMEPQHFCVWLSKANHTYRVALRAERFAVHLLTRDDLALAERFGGRSGEDVDKFAGLEVAEQLGVPVLDLPHRMLLERIAVLDAGGDHVCVTARVLDATTAGAFTPLRVSDVGDLSPGHEPDERAVQP